MREPDLTEQVHPKQEEQHDPYGQVEFPGEDPVGGIQCQQELH